MKYDLIVIGSGIVGLGHAWAAALQGLKVAVFETNSRAAGASIRNFGMIWPVGQPAGAARELALRNRELWLQLGKAAGFAVEECGSLFLAHHPDELAVLQEFIDTEASHGLNAEFCLPHIVKQMMPAVNTNNLQGGMFSPGELRVTPQTAISMATAYLADTLNVEFYFNSTVVKVASGEILTSANKVWHASKIVIASGAYYESLFPAAYSQECLHICKLQMLLTAPQPIGWKLGPHMASGPSLRHYPAFENCPSMTELRNRISKNMPEFDRFGIHIMASQNENGELILGDSHEYNDDIEPFDKSEINNLIIREIQKILNIPDFSISRTWNGLYAKLPKNMFFVREIRPDVLIVNGFGGNGMSLALAAAESIMQNWNSATTCEINYEPSF
ncbi:Monomeric sarcosine oxidase [Gimesia maris]|uniref:TIGR03364 family FAD-dependent oxidoreductase n=1 Tax=Gimesia maris TaxID=122 RepID=UPI00118A0585|nr:TIGR03364 family FAD-dependent oxidoreductase [Gimesia maris]QDT78543.1 Monomeric sarcosine oxidase [Gimesia maris]